MFNLGDQNSYNGHTINPKRKYPRRLSLFTKVFLPLQIVAQALILIQPAIYVSKATISTVAPAEIDQEKSINNPQHVSIQKQVLMGQALLEKTLSELKNNSFASNLTLEKLEESLSVEPVPETNLVQLLAEGEVPKNLQQIITTWIDVYFKLRAEQITDISYKATDSIKKELEIIQRELEAKRKQVDFFRSAHEILSTESADNQTHARLQGLNQALNKALEDEVKTKAKLDTIRSALSAGKTVVPDNDSQALANMTQRVQQLREKVAEFKSQYTPEYMQLNPRLRVVTEELAKLENQISEKLGNGSRFTLQEAENNYAAAKLAVKSIKAEIEGNKEKISDYTSQFNKFKALQAELTKLEELQQKTQQRLIEINVKQREQYPQVEIVEPANLPDKPVRPDYLLESLTALIASVFAGLFAVWIAEYLNREEPEARRGEIILSGIHLHQNNNRINTIESPQIQPHIAHDRRKALPVNNLKELNTTEMQLLFNSAEQSAQQLICLLLNGLSSEEILNLTEDSFDFSRKRIIIASRNSEIEMTHLTEQLFSKDLYPSWFDNKVASTQEVDAVLTCAAIDSKISSPEHVNAELIRSTYLLYLVKQGLKLSQLSKLFGSISPNRLVELGQFSPQQAGFAIEDINLEYPIKLPL